MNTAVRRTRPIIFSVTGLIVIFGLLYAWRGFRNGGNEYHPMPPMPVSVIQVESRHVPDELQAVGSLQAVREVLLAPDTSGRVTAINFEAGQFVKEGTLLVQLYDAPEQADRAAALARADFAQLQLRRSQVLSPTGAESRELLEQHKAEAEQATAAVKQLDARIQQKSIRAPFSGHLGIRRINLGQYLNSGDEISTLTQLDPLYVNFTLPQQDLAQLVPGASVQVTVDAAPEREFNAKVSSIEPRIDGETRNVTVQAQLSNTDNFLKSGMYATVQLSLPSSTNSIVLPLTAIQTSAFGDSVVLVKDVDQQGIGKTVVVPVTTGRRLGDEVIVTQGIKSGDIVISVGQNRLMPGASVKVNMSHTLKNMPPEHKPSAPNVSAGKK
ncbi:efflux RND transporter periplasmic adaptor subunit [Citrobacter amalonaticus]|mgnify:CR=1 FL=1|nr:efflux RND transporter periplasmic adaptor subunit [Citrobacter amalonaticus]